MSSATRTTKQKHTNQSVKHHTTTNTFTRYHHYTTDIVDVAVRVYVGVGVGVGVVYDGHGKRARGRKRETYLTYMNKM